MHVMTKRMSKSECTVLPPDPWLGLEITPRNRQHGRADAIGAVTLGLEFSAEPSSRIHIVYAHLSREPSEGVHITFSNRPCTPHTHPLRRRWI